MRQLYEVRCPHCNGELDIYDIDFRFRGNQDEYIECINCGREYRRKMRYGQYGKLIEVKGENDSDN